MSTPLRQALPDVLSGRGMIDALAASSSPSAAHGEGPWRIADTFVLGGDPAGGADWHGIGSGWRDRGVPLAGVLVATDTGGAATAALLDDALRRSADVLIMGQGIEVDPDSILELRRVAASDPMIAGVSPRPRRSPEPEAWQTVLPAVTYGPLPDPRCLYLKASVLAQFRGTGFGPDFDLDAFAMAINRAGFRMVSANHASFRRLGGADVSAGTLAGRAARLESRFPGTRAAVASFLSATARDAERILAGLGPDETGRRTVAFDLTHIGTRLSGTALVALALIRSALEDWAQDWTVAVVAPRTTYAMHFGERCLVPKRIDPADPTLCAALIRIGQPFAWKEVDAAVRRAPVLVFFMLDTIGLDTIRLAPDDLDALWRFTVTEADGLLFNSAFTERQYARRFGASAGPSRVASLHSLDCREYAEPRSGQAAGETLLIMGNSFGHKGVDATARLLAATFPRRTLVALGLEDGAVPNVRSYPSGALDHESVASLYEAAALVVYPSLYEGFGLPILEALAHRRPILVRALPPFAEIVAGVPEAANIHLFQTDEDLVALITAAPAWTDTRAAVVPRRWSDAGADLRRVLDVAVAGVEHGRILRRIDALRGRLAWVRQKSFESDPTDSEDIDRVAAFVGRMAKAAVEALARWPAGLGLIKAVIRMARWGSAS